MIFIILIYYIIIDPTQPSASPDPSLDFSRSVFPPSLCRESLQRMIFEASPNPDPEIFAGFTHPRGEGAGLVFALTRRADAELPLPGNSRAPPRLLQARIIPVFSRLISWESPFPARSPFGGSAQRDRCFQKNPLEALNGL